MRFHPAGKKIIRNTLWVALALNLIGWLFITTSFFSSLLTLGTLVMLVMVLQFFRYPHRPVTTDEKLILSPADGKICVIEECEEKDYLKTRCLKVSIFMSPLNVHINWVPVPGTVTFLKHKEGEFYAAFKDKSAEENERFCTAIRLNDGREIMATQVAGALARRILNYLKPGQAVTQDLEMGFIRFGSRVDLYLPTDTKLNVKLGQKVTGSQTIIGELS
ncbi:phosphatidylserine decarboxylase family protein [Gaoshiqia sediminis]|uniref:Phosphatidylserine decarboxylase proenzyme n=1 Tax=Gaoshiqia sediminis TaxID=2986998 RepID=A0AA41Y9B1_9BACT|nr:phosphatidylserine decarboxylase family protein [Gaoshiqia sediminis]MCW0483328.1 phosphatidylserine decarboxylase family protein [Gaoshiqia sediminis]